MTDDTRQAYRAFDGSPGRFKGAKDGDRFTGASGVLFEQAMAQTRMAICLTDPHTEDNPIVFANRAFRELTGYGEDDIIGRNCRFLQGPRTDEETVQRIRNALATEDVVVVELLNYRKDGTAFWNALHIGPIYDSEGKLVYFFGSQWDVTDVHAARADEKHARMLARELSHRVKNMFSVISGIVSITGRRAGAPEVADQINGRIRALGRAYETTLDGAFDGRIEVEQMMRSVLSPYDPAGGRIDFSGDGAKLDPNVVSMLGLTLHELATNATKYGSLSTEDGVVDVGWRLADRHPPAPGAAAGAENDGAGRYLILTWQERGGPAIGGAPERSGTGTELVRGLLAAAEGRIETDWTPAGLNVTVTVPVSE